MKLHELNEQTVQQPEIDINKILNMIEFSNLDMNIVQNAQQAITTLANNRPIPSESRVALLQVLSNI
tara:strand:- start:3735 stop:3935 length:201 start_codon:yes stop_codon:yes gene_type:complete